ncbi:MAG: hypothetical protein Q8J75_01995, partial [Rhodocyclaceae bacterium]|nr:hypothetical protein [Rhodocyclaceae bacterium]
HNDHIGGINELVARYPVPVFGPAKEAAEVVTHPLKDGEILRIPALGAEFYGDRGAGTYAGTCRIL